MNTKSGARNEFLESIARAWVETALRAKRYWCGVLGKLYGGAMEIRIANDVDELLAWVEDDSALPRTVLEATFSPDRLDRL